MENRRPTVREIQEAVALRFGVTVLDIMSDRRSQHVAKPRQVAMWIARHSTTLSIPTIGRLFNRDHTTVLHAIAITGKRMGEDTRFARIVLDLIEAVENGERGDMRQLRLVA